MNNHKVSEPLVKDYQLSGWDADRQIQFVGLTATEVRTIYEAELSRLRQERDEIVAALRDVDLCAIRAGMMNNALTTCGAEHPTFKSMRDHFERDYYARPDVDAILSKHKPE